MDTFFDILLTKFERLDMRFNDENGEVEDEKG